MKVALVHDYLLQYGGAERVLEEFASMFPDAPIYTLAYDASATGYAFEGRDIHTSFLQKIPSPVSFYKFFPLAMPLATEAFDLSDYDIILSSSASFMKGVISPAGSIHICYCHTPMRYAWLDYKKITGDSTFPSLVGKVIPFFMPYLRFWDRTGAQRVDHYICNSHFIGAKIKKYYGRDARVIYPPLNLSKFAIGEVDDYFLIVGRMVPYKRMDIAIDTFNELGLPLKIVGTGPELKRLKKRAKSNIEFVGLVSEERLAHYYASAQALIFPQEEDFGITALESMASGRPVIAYRSGGVLESASEGTTGIFFDEQTVPALKDALARFQKTSFDPQLIRASVEKFDRTHFRRHIHDFIDEKIKESQKLVLI